ncbi:hypothetical protein GJ496_004939 [Pomphorhynchus laevis]|nr:hypothetical protein GJ496_004939 [Pomphorhynchus laevis]
MHGCLGFRLPSEVFLNKYQTSQMVCDQVLNRLNGVDLYDAIKLSRRTMMCDLNTESKRIINLTWTLSELTQKQKSYAAKKRASTWISVRPMSKQYNKLSSRIFRDVLDIRYNIPPTNAPSICAWQCPALGCRTG